jgi:hypothetical protein|tara:strand:+ start:339 stop:548 length:210 start_codon:yes stop_codon:yes gene_type:complete
MSDNNLINKKKSLNRIDSNNIKRGVKMKRGLNNSKGDKLVGAIREAQKNPEFMKEIKSFIKTSTTVYKL